MSQSLPIGSMPSPGSLLQGTMSWTWYTSWLLCRAALAAVFERSLKNKRPTPERIEITAGSRNDPACSSLPD
jgi:hypothetical protein